MLNLVSTRTIGTGSFSVMISLALLSGCAQITEPQLASVDKTLVSTSAETSTVTLPNWQGFFQDSVLKQLISTSLDNNRDLRGAIAKINEMKALYGISLADRLPSVDGVVGATRSSTPADVSPAGKRMNVTTGNLQVSLPSYELDIWHRIEHLNQAALASFLASEANAQTVRLSLIADIATTYYQWQEASERLRLLKETLNNRADFLELIEKRIAVGMALDTERLQAQAIVEGIKRDMSEVERQQALAEHALTLLVGISKAQLPPLNASHQQMTQALSDNIPSTVLFKRPDVISAEHTLASAEANVKAARAAFFPRIALTGSYGTASASLDGLFASNSDMWSFTPQITLPIFNSGRTQANLDVAAARQISAVASYEKTVQTAFREVDDALSNRSSYVQQVAIQRTLLAQQQQRLTLSEKRYTNGIASYLEVLDAQRECQTAEQQLIQLIRSQQTAEVQVFKAMGG